MNFSCKKNTFCFGIGGGNSLTGLGSGHGSFEILLRLLPAFPVGKIFSMSLLEMLLRLLL